MLSEVTFSLSSIVVRRDMRRAGAGELDPVLADARDAGDLEVEVLALDALARDAAHRGDHAQAGTLLAQADDLMARVRHVMDEADRVDAAVARRSAHR